MSEIILSFYHLFVTFLIFVACFLEKILQVKINLQFKITITLAFDPALTLFIARKIKRRAFTSTSKQLALNVVLRATPPRNSRQRDYISSTCSKPCITSAIMRVARINPALNASRSVMQESSLVQSLNFSKVSFCFSVRPELRSLLYIPCVRTNVSVI